MDRRQFIKVAGAGATVTLVPSVLTGCGSASLEAWDGPARGESDPRLIALSYAILAPNSHNTQPWIVDLKGATGFDLYVDRTRLLPETDPPFRQIHISQGTFLELFDLAARQLGHRAEISYFPQGEYGSDALEDRPVASVELVPDPAVTRDPLFDQILKRQSNKGPYGGGPLRWDAIAGILGAYDPVQYPQVVTADQAQVARLGAIAVQAMEIETRSPQRNAETIAMFRFNRGEREQHRDGLGIAQTGVSAPKRLIAETFIMSREAALRPGSDFGQQTLDLTRSQAETASAFGWITSVTNTRLDQVKVGRAYARVDLAAASLGVAIHPMSQVLQEYPDMSPLRQEFLDYLKIPAGQTAQMLFRLGHARPVEHTPRRPPQALLKSPATGR